jgi:hypothetical protein
MKERQKNLFGDELEPVRTSDLVLRARLSRPLSKAQQKFNRLLARIENLRKKLERETLELNAALAYHVEHIGPRLIEAAGLRGKIVRLLTPFLVDRRMKKKGDKNALRRVIAEQLDMILDTHGTLDEDLEKIFKQVNGKSVEEIAQLESSAMLNEMETILKQPE